MRHSELWARLDQALGPAYARSWAAEHVISALGHRTVIEALEAGVAPKDVWREVWRVLELPPSLQ